ncbi:ATP-binding cassette domain-containing protein [bacterium]|nr:ATP-binding cassette domain-containing protein [bacterium]
MSIQFQHVSFAYKGQQHLVLDDVNLDVADNETLVVVGGSGSGKSTLIRCLLKLARPRSGSILVDGEEIGMIDSATLRRNMGVALQGNRLFAHLRVWENIALGLTLSGMPRAEARKEAESLLELVKLDGAMSLRFPHELSGGQQQRVCVARALATKPRYLIMDEPFGALDAITRRGLQEELKNIRSTMHVSILFVTHDLMEAFLLADRIAVMDAGKIIQCAAPETLLEKPASPVVEGLIAKPLADMKHLLKLAKERMDA